MINKLIYIMSDNRSGSTLLDQLLGANPAIMSLGEVHHLTAYALDDRGIYDPVHPLVCSCGDPVPECPFWSGVERRLGRPLGSLRARFRLFDRRRHKYAAKRFTKRTVSRIVRRFPPLLLSPPFSMIMDSRRLVDDMWSLFDAAFEQSQTRFLVDSSKDPRRMRVLYERHPDRVFAVLLARHYCGTVHSKMKRGFELKPAAEAWAQRMIHMERASQGIPADRIIRVRYEDVCTDPAAELRRICTALGAEFTKDMLARPSSGIHHLGGSPSKFDPDRMGISLDESYLTAFTDEEKRELRSLAGEAARIWGYD